MKEPQTYHSYDDVVKASLELRLKFVLPFGALLLSSFIFLDQLVYPDALNQLFLIRIISTSIMLVFFATVCLGNFSLRTLFFISDLAVVQAGAAICLMIYLTDGSQSLYFQGLNLCFMGSLTINSFRIWHNTISGFIIFVLYFIAVFTSLAGINYPDLATAIFFMSGNYGFMLIITHLFSVQHFNEFEKSRLLAMQAIELDQANHRLKASEKLKDEFFANISHELRTPLTLILGPVRRQLNEGELDESRKRDLSMIERNASLLLKHVNDLLDISRLDAGKVNVDQTVTDLVLIFKRTISYFEVAAFDRDIKVEIQTPEKLFSKVDESQIERIFFNLLSNAFKFSHSAGTVRCEMKKSADRCIFTITDSGPGVPDHMKLAIFDRFSQVDGSLTRRFGGTGLGLSIASEFVKIHDGSIRVENANGGGAKFIVDLPLKNSDNNLPERPEQVSEQSIELARLADAEHEIAVHSQAASQYRIVENFGSDALPIILVVEDNPEMNEFIAHSLADEFKVIRSYDGREGLDKALSTRPDLIITDIMMPELSGEQLLAFVRENDELENVPVILLTARADEDIREHLLNHGAQDFLCKPFQIGELKARARNLITMKKAREILGDELQSKNKDVAYLAKEVTTSKKATESALQKASEAARLKDEFLMNLSHELRTPLTAILGWTDIIEDESIEDQRLKLGFDTIRRNAKNLAQQIDDLLEIYQMEKSILRLHMQPTLVTIPLDAAISSLELTAQSKSIEITKDYVASTMKIECDIGRIQQVLLNILGNAIKFTPAGGKIHISLQEESKEAVIKVTDTGEGIEESFVPFVFERLRQADGSTTKRHSGLGLGMAISKNLVEMHGGTIQVYSRGANTGATFTVRLPLVPDAGQFS